MEQEAYYNREMLPQLVKWLKNEKYNWLIEFVKDSTHKELDFQNTEEQFSIYRGTSKILTLHQNGKIDAHKSYMDNFPGYYDKELWRNNDETILKPKLEELLDKIGDNKEQFGRYYINENGKKMEGYYQNLVSRRYSIYHKSYDKLLIFDKEFEIGYRDEKTRDTICMPEIKKWVYEKKRDVANVFREKSLPICSFLDENGHKKEFNKISTECDFVGIKKKNDNENKYELALLEVKRRTKEDDENVYLAPLQIATYYMLLGEYIIKHREDLKTVIKEMIAQKQKLGLIENVNELDISSTIDFDKIHLAIIFGGKIDELTRKKFNIVKDEVEKKLENEVGEKLKIKLFTCMDDGGKEEEQGTLKPLEDLNEINNEAYDLTEDSYRDNEKAWQIKLLCAEKEEQLFDGATGGGLYDGKTYPHVLQCGKKNLFKESAIDYFDAYGIPWHKGREGGPTGNTLSSQIACLNHLFAIREDKEAVKALVQGINKKFVCVSPIPNAYDKKKNKKAEKRNNDNNETDGQKVYISFEVVNDKDHLGEGTPTRGANCTSIDALIYAKEKCSMGEAHEKMCLIVIEWKYTEKFTTNDKSREDSGETRMKRYNNLIQKSEYLKSLCEAEREDCSTAKEYKGSVYYKETFYQLMRQTLWAEQVIKHRLSSTEEKKEPIEADDYLHLHVVPKGNEQLRTKRWKEPDKTKEPGKTMEETWRNMLKDKGKERYILIDPEELLAPIADSEKFPKYKGLINYLRTRYWDRPTETTNDDNQTHSAK